MIVFSGMPIPPSVNELFDNRIVKAGKAKQARGKFGASMSRRKSDAYQLFELQMMSWGNRHAEEIQKASEYLQKALQLRLFARIDLYIAQTEDEFIAKTGRPVGVDSNNYPKL